MKFTKVWISSFVITMTLSPINYGSIKEEFSQILVKRGFVNVEYRNLTNGIAAIHSGWKIK